MFKFVIVIYPPIIKGVDNYLVLCVNNLLYSNELYSFIHLSYFDRSDNQNREGQGDGRSGGRSNGRRERYEKGGGGVGSGVKVRGQQAGALFGGLELNVQLNYNKGK